MQRARIQEMDIMTGEVDQDEGPKWKVIFSSQFFVSLFVLPRLMCLRKHIVGTDDSLLLNSFHRKKKNIVCHSTTCHMFAD